MVYDGETQVKMYSIQYLLGIALLASVSSMCFAQNTGEIILEKAVAVPNSPKLQESEKDHFERLKQHAEQSDATAQFQLAAMYADGRGVAKDVHQAIKYYVQAAQQGHASAQFHLGRLYESQGFVQDQQKAVYWYSRAGEQGYSLKYLAAMYYEGRGVQQDYAQAFKLFQTSAEAGDIDSQYQLGKMYIVGEGVKKNNTQAIFWLEKAAKHGHGEAKSLLVEMQSTS